MACQVQQGNIELMSELWGAVSEYLYSCAAFFFYRHKDYCAACGVELSDLKQQTYIAYVESFQGFDSSRGDYKTYLRYVFQNCIRPMLKRTAFNKAVQPVSDDETSLSDIVENIPDVAALDSIDQLENKIAVSSAVNTALESLTNKEKTVIKSIYYDNITQEDVAVSLGVTGQSVSQLKHNAFRKLRKRQDLSRLADELGYGSRLTYSNSYKAFSRYGMCGAEYMAISRADMTV